MNTRKRNSGFTLVEILIVVVILGILAAIVIPQFSSAADSAKVSSMQTQLQTIRSQLELYRLQHNNAYPTGAQLWGNLTAKTTAAGSTTNGTLGPYLQKSPKNPFENSSTVASSTETDGTLGTAAEGVGWVYNSVTGEIKAVVLTATAKSVGMVTSDGDIVVY